MLRSRLPGALLLGALITVNLVGFQNLDDKLPHNFQGFEQYPHDEVLEIALITDINSRARYDLYVALAQIAPGSTFVIPEVGGAGAHENSLRLMALAHSAEIVAWPGDGSALLANIRPGGQIVASGQGASGFGAPWLVIVDPKNGVVAPGSSTDAFVFEALAEARAGAEPVPPRVFIMLHVPEAREGSTFDYQNLIIEASLTDWYAPEVKP